MLLPDKIYAQLPDWRERVRKLLAEHADQGIDQVTISQVYGGMHDIKYLVSDISYVDPAEGIRLRGLPISKVLKVPPNGKA